MCTSNKGSSNKFWYNDQIEENPLKKPKKKTHDKVDYKHESKKKNQLNVWFYKFQQLRIINQSSLNTHGFTSFHIRGTFFLQNKP